jgi:hypothetical protein
VGADPQLAAARPAAAAFVGALVLSDTIKTLTHRARPPASQAIGHWTGYAFPSGHTTKATATWGMLAALLAATGSRWGGKVAGWTAALLLVGLVALSRLYLGASWLTDVLGGLALGAAWLFALLTASGWTPWRHRRHPPAPPAASQPRRHRWPRRPMTIAGRPGASSKVAKTSFRSFGCCRLLATLLTVELGALPCCLTRRCQPRSAGRCWLG